MNAPGPLVLKLPFFKIRLCTIVVYMYMNACVSTSDAELLDGGFFWITSFVGQALSKVGLIVETASLSSIPSGLHSSTSLTILRVRLVAYQVINSHTSIRVCI